MGKINVSAAELIKQTARQWCHLHRNPHMKVAIATEGQIEGNIAAERRRQSDYIEMRGLFDYEHFNIYYCIDEIQVDGDILTFVEHKNLQPGQVSVPQWYLNTAIIQTAVYHSLALYNPHKHYVTATFKQMQGYPEHTLDIGENVIQSVLMMGDRPIHIDVLNPKKIVSWFLNKLNSAQDYQAATDFDTLYDRKESKDFEYIKQFIVYY